MRASRASYQQNETQSAPTTPTTSDRLYTDVSKMIGIKVRVPSRNADGDRMRQTTDKTAFRVSDKKQQRGMRAELWRAADTKRRMSRYNHGTRYNRRQ